MSERSVKETVTEIFFNCSLNFEERDELEKRIAEALTAERERYQRLLEAGARVAEALDDCEFEGDKGAVENFYQAVKGLEK